MRQKIKFAAPAYDLTARHSGRKTPFRGFHNDSVFHVDSTCMPIQTILLRFRPTIRSTQHEDPNSYPATEYSTVMESSDGRKLSDTYARYHMKKERDVKYVNMKVLNINQGIKSDRNRRKLVDK